MGTRFNALLDLPPDVQRAATYRDVSLEALESEGFEITSLGKIHERLHVHTVVSLVRANPYATAQVHVLESDLSVTTTITQYTKAHT